MIIRNRNLAEGMFVDTYLALKFEDVLEALLVRL
jgi:hypothetical protein